MGMRALYPEFDVRYNVDHSCGHDKAASDSLNVARMKKNYGGLQPKMRESKMVEGYLGNFNLSLKLNEMQQMVWTENDLGPHCMQSSERQKSKEGDLRDDVAFVMKTRDKLWIEIEKRLH